MEQDLCDDFNCGDNFYNHVNFNWTQNNDIPDELQNWGTFQILRKKTQERVKNIIEKSDNILNILYKQYIDMTYKIEPRDKLYIDILIDKINRCITHKDLFNLMMEIDLSIGINIPINFSITTDYNDSSNVILHIISGGLGLHDRDYYLLESKKEIRDKYLQYIDEYSKLFGLNLSNQVIFDIEKKLALKMYTRVQKRDPKISNNITTVKEFLIKYPLLSSIKKILEKTNNMKQTNKMNVSNPKYMEHLNNIIPEIPIDNWKQYFIFRIISEFNNYISKELYECSFNFYNKVILGIKSMKPRWKQAIEMIEHNMGEMVGKMYVAKYFNEESKNLAILIFNYIKEELEKYLYINDWMTKHTKERAIRKLQKMNIKIGYPDVYEKNYDSLLVNKDNTLLENIILVKKFNIKYKLARLYKPTNKNLWFMPPHSINAYYSPSYNEIVFPAGILQEPFFSKDMAYNFGAFGMVVGHEITHGFDDQGSKFDENGNLNNWWEKEDYIKYENKTKIIKDQYSKYNVNGQPVNSELTLGENIADIGGIGLSYRAYLNFLKDYPEQNTIENKKKFFYNYANIWKYKGRKEDITQKLLLDPHAPPQFRVNGVVSNMDDFYHLFDIKPDNTMYIEPDKRARIWG
jgi:putative endopeptidase